MWLLDVDGVLNAAMPGWGETPGQGKAFVHGNGYVLRWAPALAHRIAALHHSGGVEVRWATTWVDHIIQVERLLHLPPLGTAFDGVDVVDAEASVARKEAAALHVVEIERRPLIWTDDEAIPHSGPVLERIEATGQPTLLVRPSSRYGLQPEDLDEIDDFLAELTELAS